MPTLKPRRRPKLIRVPAASSAAVPDQVVSASAASPSTSGGEAVPDEVVSAFPPPVVKLEKDGPDGANSEPRRERKRKRKATDVAVVDTVDEVAGNGQEAPCPPGKEGGEKTTTATTSLMVGPERAWKRDRDVRLKKDLALKRKGRPPSETLIPIIGRPVVIPSSVPFGLPPPPAHLFSDARQFHPSMVQPPSPAPRQTDEDAHAPPEPAGEGIEGAAAAAAAVSTASEQDTEHAAKSGSKAKRKRKAADDVRVLEEDVIGDNGNGRVHRNACATDGKTLNDEPQRQPELEAGIANGLAKKPSTVQCQLRARIAQLEARNANVKLRSAQASNAELRARMKYQDDCNAEPTANTRNQEEAIGEEVEEDRLSGPGAAAGVAAGVGKDGEAGGGGEDILSASSNGNSGRKKFDIAEDVAIVLSYITARCVRDNAEVKAIRDEYFYEWFNNAMEMIASDMRRTYVNQPSFFPERSRPSVVRRAETLFRQKRILMKAIHEVLPSLPAESEKFTSRDVRNVYLRYLALADKKRQVKAIPSRDLDYYFEKIERVHVSEAK